MDPARFRRGFEERTAAMTKDGCHFAVPEGWRYSCTSDLMYSGGPEERGTISSVWQYFLSVRVRCVEHFLQRPFAPTFPETIS